jgi:hypothetical protein
MMRAFFTAAISLGTAIVACGAQTLRKDPPPASVSEAELKTASPGLSVAFEESKPVFIFLPGIMGSKLSRKVNGHDEPFWGTAGAFVGNDPAFRFDANDSITAEVLDEIYLKGLGTSFDIYASAYKEIKSITGVPDNILRFPYDWRQSNVRTAADFSKWLCRSDNQSKVKNKRVVFIAHSMGGLVLKYWLKHNFRSAGCTDTDPHFETYMTVSKIIFLGTPNYGSPKAVLAFSQGEALFFDKANDESIWRAWSNLLNWADVHIISGNLNRYGIHYPSTYQLLPIYGRSAPQCSLSNLQSDIDIRSRTNLPSNYDLFDPAAWRDLGWPVQLSGAEKEAFWKDELPGLLQEAEAFLCDVATYEVDKDFQVVNFYGTEQDTPCTIRFTYPNYRGDYDLCYGDGTVPQWIAAKGFKYEWNESDPQPHMRQVAAKTFFSYLGRLRNKLYADLAVRVAPDGKQTEDAANLFSKLNYVPTPDVETSPDDVAKIRKVADLVVDKLNIEPSQIWQTVTHELDTATRTNQMLVYSNLSGTEPRQLAWAFNNSAHTFLAKCDFRQSLALAKQALTAADMATASNPELSAEMKGLKAKSAWFAAIANGRLGNLGEANKYRALAIKNGSQLAESGSIPTPKAKCTPVSKLRPPASYLSDRTSHVAKREPVKRIEIRF